MGDLVMCRCSHYRDQHDETGRCESGDDDGVGYFDPCWCREFKPETRRMDTILLWVLLGAWLAALVIYNYHLLTAIDAGAPPP